MQSANNKIFLIAFLTVVSTAYLWLIDAEKETFKRGLIAQNVSIQAQAITIINQTNLRESLSQEISKFPELNGLVVLDSNNKVIYQTKRSDECSL